MSVLNSLSLCNELSSLSSPLAPKEQESPAGTKEVVSFLDLWRSFTMEREVTVPVRICSPLNIIEVDALLHSGATGCFVDKSWALERHLQLSKLVWETCQKAMVCSHVSWKDAIDSWSHLA